MPAKKPAAKEEVTQALEEVTDAELMAKLNPPLKEPESTTVKIADKTGTAQTSKYVSNSLIACAITVHYGGVSITLEKRIYSEAKSLQEQAAEYDKLELQLERHHAEYRTNHLPKFKPAGSGRS